MYPRSDRGLPALVMDVHYRAKQCPSRRKVFAALAPRFDGAALPRHEGSHMRVPTLPSLALLAAALLAGCGKSLLKLANPPTPTRGLRWPSPRKGRSSRPPRTRRSTVGPARRRPLRSGPRRRSTSPAGVRGGSTPGDRGRDPTLEPALLQVDLGGYSIDKYLYPNDPQKPPVTGVTRTRAAEMCQDAGGRLCTELEWERACKGPEDRRGPGARPGTRPAPRRRRRACRALARWGWGRRCASGRRATWRRSRTRRRRRRCGGEGGCGRAGSSLRAPDQGRRDVVGDDLGFRCCHGAPNAASIPAPPFQQTFRKAEISTSQLADMIATVPELKELSRDVSYYKSLTT